jgi:HSP20 family protein
MSTPRKSQKTPLTELAYLQRELEQLLGRLAEVDRSERVAAGEWLPSTDVYECRDCLLVVVEVPGLRPDSLKVVCRNRQLVISGERRGKSQVGEPVTGFLCLERPQGRFARQVPLDVPVDMQRAVARLQGGLLTVTIPKLGERRSREIVIPVRETDSDD